jgi:hypothetical protein
MPARTSVARAISASASAAAIFFPLWLRTSSMYCFSLLQAGPIWPFSRCSRASSSFECVPYETPAVAAEIAIS